MKIIKVFFVMVFILVIGVEVKAETWDEPWQKEIIKNSDYFVLAEVLSNIDSIGARIKIIKFFGNQKLTGEVLINGFSQLRLGSASGHGVHLHFDKGEVMYFFLKKREDGNYAIPTPTSGYARLDEDKNVTATYRHSYHQALISQVIYEETYTEIWNYYKTNTFNKKKILKFVNEYIGKKPAGFKEDEIGIFFIQHSALETAYLLDLPIKLFKIQKFIDADNFHSRVSAIQLLGNSKSKKSKDYLFNYIVNEKDSEFEKVIAIWALNKTSDKKYINKLIAIKNKLSEERTGFGGNIMDPRIGTSFPSSKRAVLRLQKQDL